MAFAAVGADAAMTVTSSAFANNTTIPNRYLYNGPAQCSIASHLNQSPPLDISGIPTGTNTLAIQLNDITNPWLHWFGWDIPVSGTSVSLGANYAATMATGTQGTNTFGNAEYDGPCPPNDGKTHQYVFTVYALTTPAGQGQPSKPTLSAAPQATLTGTRKITDTLPVKLQSFNVN